MNINCFYYILLLLFSCAIIEDNDTDETQKFHGNESTLDIVTWNIENFPKNELTTEFIVPIIDSLNMDIFALQEISSSTEFDILVSSLNDKWVGYKSSNSNYGELSYLIDTTQIVINNIPYTILPEYSYDFSWRDPYVLEITFNNIEYIIINVHFKSDYDADWSQRRLQASIYLEQYIETYFSDKKVILVGDFNDSLIDDDNIFEPFLSKPSSYKFTDMYIAEEGTYYWSFPTYPSHLDHILITNEIFNFEDTTLTLLIDKWEFDSFNDYNLYISDHRPVAITLNVQP